MDLSQMLRDKAALLGELRNTDGVFQVLGLLDLIELSYKERLVDVTADELPRVQSALKQVVLLRRAINGDQGVVPLLP